MDPEVKSSLLRKVKRQKEMGAKLENILRQNSETQVGLQMFKQFVGYKEPRMPPVAQR